MVGFQFFSSSKFLVQATPALGFSLEVILKLNVLYIYWVLYLALSYLSHLKGGFLDNIAENRTFGVIIVVDITHFYVVYLYLWQRLLAVYESSVLPFQPNVLFLGMTA